MSELPISIVNQLPCYLFWKDVNGIFLGCNDLFANQCGFKSNSEIVDRTDYDFPWAYTEADLYRRDDLEVISKRQKKLNYKEIQTRADGTLVQVITSKVPLLNTQGEIIGILGTAHDVYETNSSNSLSISFQLSQFPYLFDKQHKKNLLLHFRNITSPSLTDQEIECLSLWLTGYSVRESASILSISKNEINIYRDNIKMKLHVHHQNQLLEIVKEQKNYNLFIHFSRLIICSMHHQSKSEFTPETNDSKNKKLSQREAECLHYIVRGKSIKTIANILGISARTAEHYLERLKFKFGVSFKSQLIQKAIDEYKCLN